RINTVPRSPVSAVVDILVDRDRGTIDQAEADARLSTLATRDIRDDLSDYFYRPALNQQYHLSVSGGSDRYQYMMAGGYDDNTDNLIRNGRRRFSLTSNNSYAIVPDKVLLKANVNIIQNRLDNSNNSSG